MRIRCVLFGCSVSDDPACHRCHAELYTYDFLQTGLIDPAVAFLGYLRSIAKLRPFRCSNCGAFLSIPQFWREWREARWVARGFFGIKFCSQRCDDDYLPF